MKQFWDERARENAAWYVDTSLSYDDPDMERFFATGVDIVRQALVEAPVQPRGRQRAVDIGSGLGRIVAALTEHFDEVIGIDISEEMVERSREHVQSPKATFLVGDGISLRPLEDDSADLVTSFTVLQHLPTDELVAGYLQECARIVRPGGVVAVQWNNLPHPRVWKLKGAYWRLRQRFGGMRGEKRNAPEFIGSRVSWTVVESALTSGGLQIRGRAGEGTLFSWVWAVKL